MKIAVFTDLHYVEGLSKSGLDPDARLAPGLTHVERFVPDLDLIVLTGDLADKGDVASYQRLKARLQSLKTPYVPLLGNHDHRANFLEVFPEAQCDTNGFVQSVIDTPEARLIFLDTLFAPPYDFPESHKGYLCEKRLAWLEAQLSDANGKRSIIFMHHPPHNTGFSGMDTIKLKNSDAFYDVALKAGNVAHIVCGHIHRTISGNYRGISYSVFKSPMRQMPMIFDLDDFHVDVDEPPAYGVLYIVKNGLQVHTEDYGLSDLSTL